MAAYFELCGPRQIHSLPQFSVSLPVIITATFNESLLHVLHCIKLFTNVISSSQQPGGVHIITLILQLTLRLRELK